MAHLAHYKEAHPLPFVITHWINLVSMIFLIITGFVIHFPIPAIMGICRGLHIFFGFVIFIGCFFAAGDRHQALHDMLCHTVVVRKETTENNL